MRYLDDIECVTVEMDSIDLIKTNTSPMLKCGELAKFNKLLKTVNEYRNESGEIRLPIAENYDHHKVRERWGARKVRHGYGAHHLEPDESASDTSRSDSDTSNSLFEDDEGSDTLICNNAIDQDN